jgi:hypothetical protein
MWVLIFIVFSQPFEVHHVEVLGQYESRNACFDKAKSVLKDQPLRTTLSCIPINAKNIRKKISYPR